MAYDNWLHFRQISGCTASLSELPVISKALRGQGFLSAVARYIENLSLFDFEMVSTDAAWENSSPVIT